MDIIWELFKKTGNYKYYLLYKEMEKEDSNEDRMC